MAYKGLFYFLLQRLACAVSYLGIPPVSSVSENLERDVCTIGGGSSGTCSAIRLQEMGKTVALVEKEDRLGGNVHTYIDPTSNKTFDYGVIIFDNSSIVTDYFSHLIIALLPAINLGGGVSVLADFVNSSVAPVTLLAQSNLTAALMVYNEQLAKYPYLVNGFNLPDEVPGDLLFTWGHFIKNMTWEHRPTRYSCTTTESAIFSHSLHRTC